MPANAAYDRRGRCLLIVCFVKLGIDTGFVRPSTFSVIAL
jgi:hypothetical protein